MKIKFKYNGRNGMKDFNLIKEGILPIEEPLKKGQIIEIDHDHELIPRLRENALWIEMASKTKTEKTAKKRAETKETKGGS